MLALIRDNQIVERRNLLLGDIPAHKRELWREIVFQGQGSVETITIEPARVLVVLSNPPLTAMNVKVEAQRRIIALVGTVDLQACIIKQLNMLMRATELANKRATGVILTAGETAEANALQDSADRIKVIRAKSNQIEALTPIPNDYTADVRWA